MGKGIAYQFKMRFPEMNAEYVKQCKSHKLRPGILHTYFEGTKLIVNFPTKDKWREKSKMDYITSGLDALVTLIKEKQIPSIAIPPLGSGNGGLIWSEVKQLIIEKLSSLEDAVDIYVYEAEAVCKHIDIIASVNRYGSDRIFVDRCGEDFAVLMVGVVAADLGPARCGEDRLNLTAAEGIAETLYGISISCRLKRCCFISTVDILKIHRCQIRHGKPPSRDLIPRL